MSVKLMAMAQPTKREPDKNYWSVKYSGLAFPVFAGYANRWANKKAPEQSGASALVMPPTPRLDYTISRTVPVDNHRRVISVLRNNKQLRPRPEVNHFLPQVFAAAIEQHVDRVVVRLSRTRYNHKICAGVGPRRHQVVTLCRHDISVAGRVGVAVGGDGNWRHVD